MSYINNFDSKISNLLQLTEIVTPKKLSKLDILDPNGTTKANQLYRLLTEGKITTEEGLMDALFDKGPHQRGNFNRVKRQLEEKLMNTLFLIIPQATKEKNITDAYYTCYKKAAAVKILLGKRVRSVAITLAEKTFKIAERFEFTDILLTLSKDLRVHYGNVAGDKKKFQYYNLKVKHYSNVFIAELNAEEYYSTLTLMISLSRSPKAELKEMAKRYANKLEKILNEYQSYRLNLISYYVIALRYEIAYDYRNTIETCDRALSHFENKKHLATNTAKFTFLFRKISSQLLLGLYPQAQTTANICLNLQANGHHNWYKTLEYLFIINQHSNNYQKAYEIYCQAIDHKDFKNQYPDVKEAWYIYEAYMYYFFLKEAIKGPFNHRIQNFRINRFFNAVPTYSKDKRGLNIALNILQILFLLHQEKYDRIIDRTEALRTYTHRYLRRDETFRSNCFIKMLMQLPKANFHKTAVIRKTKDLHEKLNSVGIIQNQSAEVEAVPYEILWEFVLQSLDNKIH